MLRQALLDGRAAPRRNNLVREMGEPPTGRPVRLDGEPPDDKPEIAGKKWCTKLADSWEQAGQHEGGGALSYGGDLLGGSSHRCAAH